MVDRESVAQGHDDTGTIGDHDVSFVWGNWRVYVTTLQQARLTVMRGYVLDYRAGERGGAADGDLPIFTQTESGLFVLRDVVGS